MNMVKDSETVDMNAQMEEIKVLDNMNLNTDVPVTEGTNVK